LAVNIVVLIIVGSFVLEAIAVAFFVWWRIFRRPRKGQQFGSAWAAGGMMIGGGVDDHGTGSSHTGWGCGGGSGHHGGGCGGGGGGGCGGGGGGD
jgi:hypothetical protein